MFLLSCCLKNILLLDDFKTFFSSVQLFASFEIQFVLQVEQKSNKNKYIYQNTL